MFSLLADRPLSDANDTKSAGRPRAGDQEARLLSLIETAAHLFLEKGYSKVSLEMIARKAHVAVRTIYVKFGGKAGLFKAVIVLNREQYFSDMSEMETDTRPIRQIINEFATRFLNLISQPEAISVQRMVIAEAKANPDLAKTFFDAGPRATREELTQFFARPEIRAQIRDDVPLELLPTHLLNCIIGDTVKRYLIEPEPVVEADRAAALAQRLELFYRSVLRAP